MTSEHSDNVSEPTNDNVKSVLNNDKIRYKRKGYGLITASIMTACFFFYGPEILLAIWPAALALCSYKGDPSEGQFKLKMTFLFVYLGHNVFFLIGQLMHLVLYKIKLPFFEKYKINPERAWPWEKDMALWRVQLGKSIRCIALWVGVISPLMICMDHFVLDDMKMAMTLEQWPSRTTVIKQIVFFMCMEDLLFYWAHRLLHLPSVYPYIHKRHHEFKDTISIASEYAHPVESFLANTLPTVAGYKMLGG